MARSRGIYNHTYTPELWEQVNPENKAILAEYRQSKKGVIITKQCQKAFLNQSPQIGIPDQQGLVMATYSSQCNHHSDEFYVCACINENEGITQYIQSNLKKELLKHCNKCKRD